MELQSRMKVAGVIIAGGKSSRLGQEKALLRLAAGFRVGNQLQPSGMTLLEMIAGRIAPQVAALVINANGNAKRFERFNLAVIPDAIAGAGSPLAGLHAGLCWARENGFGALLTVPSDCPFLPSDLVVRLQGESPVAAVAVSGGNVHHLTGLWSQTLLEKLGRALETRAIVRVRDWAVSCGAAHVEWPTVPYDPFFNINTAEDLAEAKRIATITGIQAKMK